MTSSFIEIYNDNIYDLLVSTTGSLNIREDTRTGEVYVENLTQVTVRSPMQLLELISLGSRTRVTASTLMVLFLLSTLKLFRTKIPAEVTCCYSSQ